MSILTCTLGLLELSSRYSSLEQLVKLSISSSCDVRDPDVDEKAADDTEAEEHVACLGTNGRQLKGDDNVGDGSDDCIRARSQSGGFGTEASGTGFASI